MLSTMGGQMVPDMAEGLAMLQTFGQNGGGDCGERCRYTLSMQSMSTRRSGSYDGLVTSTHAMYGRDMYV